MIINDYETMYCKNCKYKKYDNNGEEFCNSECMEDLEKIKDN